MANKTKTNKPLIPQMADSLESGYFDVNSIVPMETILP